MEIDNFDIFLNRLTFENDYDRYIVHVLKRVKDEEKRLYGASDTNRLIKTFYISSKEYLERKIPVIKDLCVSNGARAYILPQVRSNFDCLVNLAKITLDNLQNPTQKPDHLVRSAYCGNHKSRDKKWILDLDYDEMTEYKGQQNFGGAKVETREWTPEEVMELIRGQLSAIGKDPDSAYMVPTKSGCHIITSPFNQVEAYKKCGLIFEGEQKVVSEVVWTGPGEYELKRNKIVGWLHKDGMSLLYCQFPDKEQK